MKILVDPVCNGAKTKKLGTRTPLLPFPPISIVFGVKPDVDHRRRGIQERGEELAGGDPTHVAGRLTSLRAQLHTWKTDS